MTLRPLSAIIDVLSITFTARRFMKHVEKTIQARPVEANLGGVPTVQNKIRAYITVKYSKMGQWTASNLEVRPLRGHRLVAPLWRSRAS